MTCDSCQREKNLAARGLCWACYTQQRRSGDLDRIYLERDDVADALRRVGANGVTAARFARVLGVYVSSGRRWLGKLIAAKLAIRRGQRYVHIAFAGEEHHDSE